MQRGTGERAQQLEEGGGEMSQKRRRGHPGSLGRQQPRGARKDHSFRDQLEGGYAGQGGLGKEHKQEEGGGGAHWGGNENTPVVGDFAVQGRTYLPRPPCGDTP